MTLQSFDAVVVEQGVNQKALEESLQGCGN